MKIDQETFSKIEEMILLNLVAYQEASYPIDEQQIEALKDRAIRRYHHEALLNCTVKRIAHNTIGILYPPPPAIDAIGLNFISHASLGEPWQS
ncbi:MAG: hypothetical protein JWM68_3754 [Verrucomicrobiales bacterium]|nr:hypothetical protein [Verrucomicrobiales bacterium]